MENKKEYKNWKNQMNLENKLVFEIISIVIIN